MAYAGEDVQGVDGPRARGAGRFVPRIADARQCTSSWDPAACSGWRSHSRCSTARWRTRPRCCWTSSANSSRSRRNSCTRKGCDCRRCRRRLRVVLAELERGRKHRPRPGDGLARRVEQGERHRVARADERRATRLPFAAASGLCHRSSPGPPAWAAVPSAPETVRWRRRAPRDPGSAS